MVHGADLKKKRPPIEYKATASTYNVEPSVLNASREQAEVCRLCLENNRVRIDDLMAKTLKESPYFKDTVKTCNQKCCATKDDTEEFVCDTYRRIREAYNANVQSRGLTMNACRYCPAYIDNRPHSYGLKACLGNSEIKPIMNKAGKW